MARGSREEKKRNILKKKERGEHYVKHHRNQSKIYFPMGMWAFCNCRSSSLMVKEIHCLCFSLQSAFFLFFIFLLCGFLYKLSKEFSMGTNFSAHTIGAVYRKYSTKQKAQELGCLRPWLTDHKVVPHIQSGLVYRKNLFIWIDT